MEKLLEKWTSSLSYEFVGVIVPGVLGVACICSAAALYDVMCSSNVALTYIDALRAQTFSLDHPVSIAAAIVVVYIIGHLSTDYGKRTYESAYRIRTVPYWKITKWLHGTIWFPLNRIKPRNYRSKSDFENARAALKETFKIETSGENEDKEWSSFYGPASRLILQSDLKTMVTTFQNKYSLHRTLAFSFSILWKACIIIWIYSEITCSPTWDVRRMAILLITTSFVLACHFRRNFLRFWMLFGNTICWEISTLKSKQLTKAKSKDAEES